MSSDGILNAEDVSMTIPTSTCSSVCSRCVETVNPRYSYLHGDVLILGLFSIRQYGDTPFSCGLIRRGTNDIITVSAFMESVKKQRQDTGINFGAIAFDDCYNGLNTSDYIMDLLTKQKFITNPETDEIVDFDDVVTIIGALSSGVTLSLADIATSLNISMISYGASSPDLDNRVRYPYFLRTVPSDTLQVQGMVKLLVYMGVTHVGLVYIDDVYGRSGKKALLVEAEKNNICIEEPIATTQSMTENEVEAVMNTLFKQEVRVVLFFSIDSIAKMLLDILDRERNDRQLIFIASDGWGTNQNLAEIFYSHGSLVFTIDTRDAFMTEFKSYLQTLNISQTENNYWIPNYFEDFNNCDVKTSFEKSFSKICTNNQLSNRLDTETVNSLYSDQRGVHTKIAVHATTTGYTSFCKSITGCSATKARSAVEKYVEEIKKAQLKDSNIFNDAGNGNIGFTINNIQFETGSDQYKNQYVKVINVQKYNSYEIC